MDGWADGLNYYLHTHPEVMPRVITRFEPWMALTFTRGEHRRGHRAGEPAGSGGVLRRGPPRRRRACRARWTLPGRPRDARGAHRLQRLRHRPAQHRTARAPAHQPHTSFYFRSEPQMTSDEGLNAYGAITWGQFFVYQGFNETPGWMHTSSGVDNIDEFLETVVERDDALYYRHGGELRPVAAKHDHRALQDRDGHGADGLHRLPDRTTDPWCGQADGKWISVALMEDPINALIQSYTRTKATNLDEFLEIMELHTNSSNNTLFADADGNIAYLHSNFIPRRDTGLRLDAAGGRQRSRRRTGTVCSPSTRRPTPSTRRSAGSYNTNNWPWSAAGADSPRREDFPAYVESGLRREPPGRARAGRCWRMPDDFTLDVPHRRGLRQLPARVRSTWCRRWYGRGTPRPAGDPLKARAGRADGRPARLGPRWGVPFGGHFAGGLLGDGGVPGRWAARLARAGMELGGIHGHDGTPQGSCWRHWPRPWTSWTEDFGTWETPWGEINRFQRLDAAIASRFDDDLPSIPRAVHVGAVGLPGLLRRAGRIRTPRSGTAPAATASWPWWSSATGCGPGP